jgi:prophage maintenance system killer protein
MDEIRYITPEDLIEIIDVIQGFDYISDDEIPKYDEQPEKIDDYFALVDRLKNDTYYPNIFSKAATLFLNVNGHYFANGNKRLAVFSMTYFLESNGLSPAELSKDDFSNVITEIFGEHELEDYENFSPTDFAMYNVALITAQFNQNNVDFDDGKAQVEQFLQTVYAD